MSVYIDESQDAPPQDEIEKIYADVDRFNQKLKESGAWVFAGGLHPSDTATIVRSQEGEVLTTDGPYAEAKEQIGGFWIVEADNLDVVLDLASQATVACQAPVEVRPFQNEPED